MSSRIRPPRVGPGSTLGIVAPSSPIPPDLLDRGIRTLETLGFRVAVADHVYDRWGYLAGLDERRAADLTAFFARPDIHGIICARGGYGAARMVDLVDWDAARLHPKVFIGFSDITTLHLALERTTGLITFHGPMVITLAELCADECITSFMRAIESADPIGCVGDEARPGRTLVSGKAMGRLAGGCVTLLCSAIGTPYEPDFTDRIVILEDTEEPLYRVDRFLVHLRSSGILNQAAGFVVGTSSHWERYPEANHGMVLDDIWAQLLVPLGKPTIVDYPIGHVQSPLTLPLGCTAELDADRCLLTVTQSAVQ